MGKESVASLIETIRNRTKDENGFTMVDLMTGIIVMGIMTAIACPLLFAYIKAAATDTLAKELPTIGEEFETFFAKNPNVTGVGTEKVVKVPENIEDLHVAFAGTSSDYCVISTADYDGSRRLEKGDTSYDTGQGFPYIVYYGSTGEVVETSNISGLSCVKSGVSLL